MSELEQRLESVLARIRAAEKAHGRAPGSVSLVCVSKTHPEGAVREAYALGQRDFGESYAQELAEKAEALRDLPDLRWHFIGHLQRNKAKLVARVAYAVHSIDGGALARELGKRAAAAGFGTERPRMRAFAEVNSGEAQKHGAAPEELAELLVAIEAEPALELVGLMTVPPHGEAPTREAFTALARLRDAHGGAARLPELSMGMTDDLEIAIELGATIVRIGTAIFGPREA